MHCTLDELLERNPTYAALYLQALAFCATQRPEAEVLAHVDEARVSRMQIQSASAIVETLERRGGLARTILVDGEPYAGTQRDLQQDDTVPAEARIEHLLHTTEEGRALLAAQPTADEKLAALLEENPTFAPGFEAVLALCVGEGKTTRDIQEDLRALGALPKDPRTGVEQVHASFFTGALEKAGALVWKGGRWVTVSAGR